MFVTFTKTGPRRYRISVEGPGVVSSWMEPAPGYDDRLPHDMAHFVVENELGISGGVFGQLAAGGTAGTFRPFDSDARRKVTRRGKRISAANRDDALLSEKAVAVACGRSNNDPLAPTEARAISDSEIDRICSVFDKVSSKWSNLTVGESMTLEWSGRRSRRKA